MLNANLEELQFKEKLNAIVVRFPRRVKVVKWLSLYRKAMEQNMNCPQCGALCLPRFNEFLALEFSDPGYGAAHNLTVTASIVQHSSQLTREGWLLKRSLLREFVVEGKSPALALQERPWTAANAISKSNRCISFELKKSRGSSSR